MRYKETLEQDPATVLAFGDVCQYVGVGDVANQDYGIGVLVGLSAGAVAAICGAIVVWLRSRHPPDNK